jgi:hypothetical protein
LRFASAKKTEKEQEDLLVLLDEPNGKREQDKQRMRKTGMDVSEDEDKGIMMISKIGIYCKYGYIQSEHRVHSCFNFTKSNKLTAGHHIC